MIGRAMGCLIGHLAGDSLGSRYEFMLHPKVKPVLEDGGFWGLAAGQPTDDGELMLTLAMSIVTQGGFSQPKVLAAYQEWYDSMPFDIGSATSSALRTGLANHPRVESNGALMRVAPIGVAYWRDPVMAEEMARDDAAITHRSFRVQQLSGLYARAIAIGIKTGDREAMLEILESGTPLKIDNFHRRMGWVELAYSNAVRMLREYQDDLMTAVVQTVARGGDTDTNAAITGALLGAGGGIVPAQWSKSIYTCDTTRGVHPRPALYGPNAVRELVQELVMARAPI